MANFLEIVTDVMDTINRPMTETGVVSACEKRVNDAIRQVQRKRAFRLTERLVQVTYPASALTVDLTAVCEGTLRDLICVQLLGTSAANGGTILPYKSYAQLQRARQKYQSMHEAVGVNEWQYVNEFFGHENYTTRVHRYYVFLLNGKLGLYSVPTTAVELLVFAHVWLPDLADDTDTNFLLDWGYDVIHALAVKKMCMYLKQDVRQPLTKEEFDEALLSLYELDSQMSESYVTTQE